MAHLKRNATFKRRVPLLVLLGGLSACEIPVLRECSGAVERLSGRTTRKPGALENSEIWSGEVTLQGDLFVGNGCSLTVEAGTLVRVLPDDRWAHAHAMHFDGSLVPLPRAAFERASERTSAIVVLEGSLELRGTSSNPVRFRASEGSWSGIVARRPKLLSIRGAEIGDAYRGLEVIGYVSSAPLRIQDSLFERTTLCGLCLGGEDSGRAVAAEIRGNRFRDGGGSGIEAHAFVSGVVEANFFEGYRGTPATPAAAARLRGNALSFLDNTFERNDIGVDCAEASTPGFAGNRFGAGAQANGTDSTCPDFAP